MAAQGPTLRRQRLGRELRALREAAGLTCKQVGDLLEWSEAKVSRIETAKVRVHPNNVAALLDVYGVTEAGRRDDLLTLSRESRQGGGWLSEYLDAVAAPRLWIEYEAEAVAVRSFDALVVNGLLQTQDYARAVLRAAWHGASVEELERRVEARMRRQEVLTRPDPLRLQAVVDEGVLRRQVGGPAVLRAQLDHLLELTAYPNVTLQVLPFSAGAHAGVDGPFEIFTVPPPDTEVVAIESNRETIFNEEEVDRFSRTFGQLSTSALSAEESVEFIERILTERGST